MNEGSSAVPLFIAPPRLWLDERKRDLIGYGGNPSLGPRKRNSPTPTPPLSPTATPFRVPAPSGRARSLRAGIAESALGSLLFLCVPLSARLLTYSVLCGGSNSAVVLKARVILIFFFLVGWLQKKKKFPSQPYRAPSYSNTHIIPKASKETALGTSKHRYRHLETL